MIQVSQLVSALDAAGLLAGQRGAVPSTVTGIADDTRRLESGAVFVAVRGAERDGHEYLGRAAERGAALAILEDASHSTLPALVVRDGRRAAAVAASAAFDDPARALTLVGVTGTNGKTTTVHILRHLLDAGGAAASIGTLGVLVGSEGAALGGGASLTTPGPVELQRLLRRLVDDGVRTVAMEVSSHALDQRRVEGLRFAAAVFTNLTRDHLDYHGTMEAYLAAKARLVSHLAADGAAVINADRGEWDALPAAPRVLRYSATGSRTADIRAAALAFAAGGSAFHLVVPGDARDVRLPLIGDFNVANALGAAGAALALGRPLDEVVARLATTPQVPGRLELVHEHPAVLRDYAHTPDALARAIEAVRPFVGRGRLVTVFGCGGDRDRGKRPEMGTIAEALSDRVILTSDNPRTEDPERILDDIEAGMHAGSHERVEDRRAAISRALQTAGPEDVVLLAGKGHETYQIRGTEKLPFDERSIVAELSAQRGEGRSGSTVLA